MGKVFTITEGLENLGAIRTGGQGSVYKGRRIGEIFVAVKILPTPIHAESEDDKHFKDFLSEVNKLKKVNENPTPHVVKILNSGITESGSLPFIEMEFIEGPDLSELLKEPNDPIFTIHETIKLADQLASALSHCHKVSVKHGDIKSNNVKLNIHTGNYVLLDFGLAIMSDEQRRDSLKNAGAVEFMAPEQNEGIMLPQSDVYSYGVILYELLAGVVPFPLNDNGNSARNNVMIAHMETPVPDLLELRKQNMPYKWPDDKKDLEMQVPEWLLSLIAKCLEKKPEDRFADGTELYEAILLQSSALAIKNDSDAVLVLQNENETLQAGLWQEQETNKGNQKEIDRLKALLSTKDAELAALQNGKTAAPVNTAAVTAASSKGMSAAAAWGLGLLLLCVGVIAGKYVFSSNKSDTRVADSSVSADTISKEEKPETEPEEEKPAEKKKATPVKKDKDTVARTKDTVKTKPEKKPVEAPKPNSNGKDVGKVFTLFNTYAYFHDRPDASTKRKANINRWNNARLKALDDRDGFIYVIYTNEKGQVSKGWLDKKTC